MLRLAAPSEAVELRDKLEGGMREIFHTLLNISPEEDSLMRMLRAPGVKYTDLVPSGPDKPKDAPHPLRMRETILSQAKRKFLEEVEPPWRRKASVASRASVKTAQGSRASVKRRPAAAPSTCERHVSA